MIDHYENPRNVGKLDPKKRNVGTGLVGAPACGDVMKLQIEVRGRLHNVIKDIIQFDHYLYWMGIPQDKIRRGVSRGGLCLEVEGF